MPSPPASRVSTLGTLFSLYRRNLPLHGCLEGASLLPEIERHRRRSHTW
jgi:hypothetical protein